MSIVAALTEIGEGLASTLTKIISSIGDVFFTQAADGGAITLKPLGYIALIGLALSLVYFAINFVMRLVKARR